MAFLISILLIVEVISAFLLVVVILAQKSKDQGLGMAFGGGMGESLFGSRAGNVLTRMTVGLAVVFMVNTILLGILFARGAGGGGTVMDRADRAMPLAPVGAPVQPMLPEASPVSDVELPMVPVEATAGQPIVLTMDESGELVPAEGVSVVAEQVTDAVESAQEAVADAEVAVEAAAEEVVEEATAAAEEVVADVEAAVEDVTEEAAP